MRSPIRFAYVLLFVVCCSLPLKAESTPASDELGKAFKQAEKDKRLVLAVFVKPNQEDSTKYQSEALADADVKAWIEKNAVLCVVSSDDAELVKEYFVDNWPTSVFMNSDSVIQGRIERKCGKGFLLEEAAGILAGTTDLAVARKAYEKDPKDVKKRYAFAQELAAVADFRVALEHYLWLFDNILKHEPAYLGVRLSFMLGDIADIGKRHPVALDELRKRRDAARKELLGSAGTFEQAMDFTSINEYLNDLDNSLQVHAILKKDAKASKQVVEYIAESCVEALAERKRYKEAAEIAGDLEGACKKQLNRADMPDVDDEELKKQMEEIRKEVRRIACVRAARLVEVACGCGDFALAGKLAKAITTKVKEGQSYAAIIDAAVRAGSSTFAIQMRDEGLKAFDKAADLEPIRTAAKNIPQD